MHHPQATKIQQVIVSYLTSSEIIVKLQNLQDLKLTPNNSNNTSTAPAISSPTVDINPIEQAVRNIEDKVMNSNLIDYAVSFSSFIAGSCPENKIFATLVCPKHSYLVIFKQPLSHLENISVQSILIISPVSNQSLAPHESLALELANLN